MNNQIQLSIPKWFVQDELHIIETIVSEISATTGIVIAGENFDASKRCKPTVRIYMIRLIDDQYKFLTYTALLGRFCLCIPDAIP